MRYTFGHTNTAAERLKRIADFFNPLAADIIRDHLQKKINKTCDFGCGPGYTTDMLARSTHAEEIIGIDISSYFLDLARQTYPDYQFIQDDVTQLKTKEKYDFIYCRFLLSHLPNTEKVITRWMEMLNHGGILFIDELEAIETDISVFKKYLFTNHELIKSQGAELYIGGKLNKSVNGFRCIQNRSNLISVKDSLAASWFFPNTISIWKDDPFVQSTINEEDRNRLSDELLQIWQKGDNASHITWKMKRILLTI
jgi:trans-aconitate 2-methyltransferase